MSYIFFVITDIIDFSRELYGKEGKMQKIYSVRYNPIILYKICSHEWVLWTLLMQKSPHETHSRPLYKKKIKNFVKKYDPSIMLKHIFYVIFRDEFSN